MALLILIVVGIILFVYFVTPWRSLRIFFQEDLPVIKDCWSRSAEVQKIAVKLSLFLYCYIPAVDKITEDYSTLHDIFSNWFKPFLSGLAESLLAVGFVMLLLEINQLRQHNQS